MLYFNHVFKFSVYFWTLKSIVNRSFNFYSAYFLGQDSQILRGILWLEYAAGPSL
jgi:hypothetical protein